MKDFYEIDEQDVLHINLHPGQSRVWVSDRRFVLMLAGSQGGKTVVGPEWLRREIYGGELKPGVEWPGRGAGDYLAVTSSYDLFKLKMLPAIRECFEGLWGLGRYWAGDGIIELADPETREFHASKGSDPMWGRIILRSANAQGGLESSTAKAAWLDEAGQDSFTVDAWDAIRRRLSLHQGRVLITTTPYNLGWLKTELYDKWEDGDPDIEVVQFDSAMNPAFPQEEFEERRASMPEWKFEMFYRGRFTRPASLIYGDFDSRRHVIGPPTILEHWPVYLGVDFGAVNNATVMVAHDTERDQYIVFFEDLAGDVTTEQHVQANLRRLEPHNFVSAFGGSGSEVQQRRDWRMHGLPVHKPPITDVEAQIDDVIGLFKADRLLISKDCRRLIDQLGSYSRELDADAKPTDKIRDKEAYHLLDALRYVVCGILRRQRRQARTLRG